MRILITGIAGFIGSHLAERLISEGNEIIGIDNFDSFYSRSQKEKNLAALSISPIFKLYEGDICDSDFLQTIFSSHKIELVIHLAAKAGVRPSILDPESYYHVNVMGTLSLLRTMQNHSVKSLIFASSSSVYGNNKKIPFSETDNVDFPISPYAASKKAGELLTYTYHHLHHFKVMNLRFFTVYGPRQRPDLAIHKFLNNIYKSLPIDIYGDGSTSRDYTYVDDIVEGIFQSIIYLKSKKSIYEIVNLGNNNPLSLSDLVWNLELIIGTTIQKKYYNTQEGDVDKTFADIKKARQLLGFNPETTIEDGLRKFKIWYEANI